MSHAYDSHVLFLGYSFIWRLENFIQHCTSPNIKQDFDLPLSTQLHFHGVGKCTVRTLRQHDWSIVASFRPTILILDIGSNDLANHNIPVDCIAANIMALLYDLHSVMRVSHIILGQILPRFRPQRSCHDYNLRVARLNSLLLTSLKLVPFATLWFHRAITRNYQWVFWMMGYT